MLLRKLPSQPRSDDVEEAVDCGQQKILRVRKSVTVPREEAPVVKIISNGADIEPLEEEDLAIKSAGQHQEISRIASRQYHRTAFDMAAWTDARSSAETQRILRCASWACVMAPW